jgi:hypothetical protein
MPNVASGSVFSLLQSAAMTEGVGSLNTLAFGALVGANADASAWLPRLCRQIDAEVAANTPVGKLLGVGDDFLFFSLLFFSLLFSYFLLGNSARSQLFPRGKNSDLPSSPRAVASSKKIAKPDHF